MELNEILGLDTLPIRVNNDGTITEDITEVTAPVAGEYGVEFEDDIAQGIDGWTAWNGYSNQHGYSGPVFDPSEVIGGGLEKDILNTPGYYAVEEVYDAENDWDGLPYGWVLLYKELD